MNTKNEPATLIDRLALGFGSAVIAFITGTIVWLSFYLLLAKTGEYEAALQFYPVWFFTGFGFILGAF